MDIRKYFGSSAGKSALTDLRTSRRSPQKTSHHNQNAHQKTDKIRKTVAEEVLFSDTSGEENPMPRSLRRELKKKRVNKRIVISSDDDELPPSASEIRSKKLEVSSPITTNKKSFKSPVKRTATTVDNEESDVSDDLDGFIPTRSGAKKRRQIPPNQTKLKFTSFTTAGKDLSPKKRGAKIVPELETINPAEFFRNFGKTSEEMKKNEGKGGKSTETKSPVKVAESTFSALTSPKKFKHGSKTDSETDMVILSPTSSIQAGSLKPVKKSPKKTKAATIKSLIESEEKAISKEEKMKKKQDFVGVRNRKKISDKGADSVDHVNEDSTDGDNGASTSHKNHRKSLKNKRTRETKSIEIDVLDEVGAEAQEDINLPWVDKYKPSSLKHLVGQSGEKSPMNKLLAWLREWSKNHLGGSGKQKKGRPPPWLAQSDGSAFKAVMLSGPPGVGKTTCAVMACKELGLRYVEKNASDVRNKKVLEEQTSELIACQQMDGYVNDSVLHEVCEFNGTYGVKHVLIMDEVDGMSGNDDRAGIAELIQMIKETRIPIICLCNDRQSQKMRSLMNYCFDIRFQRPRVEQIRARLLSIASQEKCKYDVKEIDEIIEAAQHDVRQSIYNLQLLSRGGNGSEAQRKDVAMNPFEAARRLLNADTPAWEKQQMFFVDYSLMPLFVQENYPFVHNSKMSVSERLVALKKAASSISQGDLIDRMIRTTGAWTLLNEQAVFSSVAPTSYMNGYMKGMINFPTWLGKNSTMNKRHRLLRQLTAHAYLRTLAATYPMALDYAPVLRHRYCRLLLDEENDGINTIVELYKEYHLIRDDTESIAELTVWPGINDPGVAIPAKVKASLTRALNKAHFILPYALDAVMKGRKNTAIGGNLDLELDEEGNLMELTGGEGNLEDNGGTSDDDADDFVSITKRKSGVADENGGLRSGRGRGGNRGTARGSRGTAGRGRSSKK